MIAFQYANHSYMYPDLMNLVLSALSVSVT